MMSPEEAYKYDATFRRVVDLMRAHLSVYEITPSELRQAAILAAIMHESQRVKPLFTRSYFPAQPWGGMEVFIDEAKDIPPAMFGGWTMTSGVEEHVNHTCGVLKGKSTSCTARRASITTGISTTQHVNRSTATSFVSSGYGYDVCNDCGYE